MDCCLLPHLKYIKRIFGIEDNKGLTLCHDFLREEPPFIKK